MKLCGTRGWYRVPAFARSRQQRNGACAAASGVLFWRSYAKLRELTMAWTTPTLVEICLGLEINGYLPAEF
jgi:coenzyme PQQ precursor peptide PqqA